MPEKIAVGEKFVRTSEWRQSCGIAMPIDTVLQRVVVDRQTQLILYVGCFYTGLRSQVEKEQVPRFDPFTTDNYWRETGISKSR